MASKPTDWDPKMLARFRELWGPDFIPPFPWLPEAREVFRPLSAAMGEILSRPTLDLKTRAVIIFSTMVALGYKAEAKLYIQGLRNLGYSTEQIAEIILQVALYAGLPRGVDANMLLKEVVDEDKERAKAKGFFYQFPRS